MDRGSGRWCYFWSAFLSYCLLDFDVRVSSEIRSSHTGTVKDSIFRTGSGLQMLGSLLVGICSLFRAFLLLLFVGIFDLGFLKCGSFVKFLDSFLLFFSYSSIFDLFS
ncbi:hypothetical protein Cni_G18128 [Canna indica]|uniref:Uncharacterized protein n=1 Tax=Canna indica TaxID=4628 RepID=A0AAQ3QIE9_9LILI|nr:hypothetical protein Cni_G18128 [Canna indica]